MTTIAVADELLGFGLLDHERERVGDGRPDGDAPEQAREQPEVEAVSAGVSSRRHDATVLLILAATQMAWAAALAYGLFHLLT